MIEILCIHITQLMTSAYHYIYLRTCVFKESKLQYLQFILNHHVYIQIFTCQIRSNKTISKYYKLRRINKIQ